MIAVLTGDIVDSTHQEKDAWLPALKSALINWGKEGKEWEIYRGDEFQLRLRHPERALVESGPLVRSSYHSERHVDPGYGRGKWLQEKALAG